MAFASAMQAMLQNQPQFETRQALIILGCQKDFLNPDGKLPVNLESGFLNRIRSIVPMFRQYGDIVWVRTEFREERAVNNPQDNGCAVITGATLRSRDRQDSDSDDSEEETSGSDSSQSTRLTLSRRQLASEDPDRHAPSRQSPKSEEPGDDSLDDDELFLSRTADREPCCLPGTPGAEFAEAVVPYIDETQDILLRKSYYSAFQSTSLLLTLRTKLATEVFLCGCMTNLSVYATAMDAARHGLAINVIEDCLGYRKQERHDEAIKQMVDLMGADIIDSDELKNRLSGEEWAEELSEGSEDEDQASVVRQPSGTAGIERSLADMRLRCDLPAASAAFSSTSPTQHAKPAGIGTPDRNTKVTSQLGGNARSATGSDEQTGKSITDQQPTLTFISRDLADEWDTLQDLGHDEAHKTGIKDPQLPCAGNLHGISVASSALHPADLKLESNQSPHFETSNKARDNPKRTPRTTKKVQNLATFPTLVPNDSIGSGSSRVIHDLLPPEFASTVFQTLYNEVRWQRMYHATGEVPRLVCCQGAISATDGSMPVYRHPSDQTLPLMHFSPTVRKIKKAAEARAGHELNHVLVQLYRSGQDFISEHSDKTLDIVPGSCIVNVSFGAQRTMRLRTKGAATKQGSGSSVSSIDSTASTARGDDFVRARTTQRIHMPHNSVFIMDLDTNARWLHGIQPDKRIPAERSAAELAYGGMRISLTFRHIGTYLSHDSRYIWGQGATSKSEDTARATINNVPMDSEQMIKAFGTENQSTDFDWHATYGHGYDVLHLKTALPDKERAMLFLSGNEVEDLPVKLMLSEFGVSAEEITPPPLLMDASLDKPRSACFRDTDVLHTEVTSTIPILLYLERLHTLQDTARSRKSLARTFETVISPTLGQLRRTASSITRSREDVSGTSTPNMHNDMVTSLLELERLIADDDNVLGDLDEDEQDGSTVARRQGHGCFAGDRFGIADALLWPAVKALKGSAFHDEEFRSSFPALNEWFERVGRKDSVRSVLEAL
ncbi:hypothetical protein LTR50_005201 [Elasticomyces elasticus]|nr:hypothetical protein LTR50_005201 [Elasticomyces elasticus]